MNHYKDEMNNQVYWYSNEDIKIAMELNAIEEKIASSSHEDEKKILEGELNLINPVYFEIRDNIFNMRKMTDEEVCAHRNPKKSKEQHISEAEMKKQLHAEDAEKNITILERKVKLNIATDDDKNSLTAWEIYSIKIADIDTSLAPDIEWPQKP
ncbi:TPA: tail fiber assembly protein [Providencia alcalifaciens]